jgi:CMP-N-acetylneuraminic acid synthetase
MKAHSERVPGKNFRPMAGKPLVRWILDALLDVEVISKVVINTDARELLEEIGVVDSDRVSIRDRKPELCGDMVSMNLILEDDITATDADLYLMTHTTNPLITAETIRDAIHRIEISDGADSLFSVNKTQTRFYREDGEAVNHDPDNLIRTQDLEPWFEENSCLYLFTKDSFAATGARIGKRPMMFETPALESIDIDEPHDWFIGEAVLEKLQREMAPE